MPALFQPTYAIERLYLFPYYADRDAYEQALGEEPPPYDHKRAPKRWFDPKAKDATRRNVVYDQVLATSQSGTTLVGPEGKPVIDVLVLLKEEAATVNIPPPGAARADLPEVPMPLRPLEPNEEVFFDLFGVVAVRNLDLTPLENGFSARDRSLLQAIARKLGI